MWGIQKYLKIKYFPKISDSKNESNCKLITQNSKTLGSSQSRAPDIMDRECGGIKLELSWQPPP